MKLLGDLKRDLGTHAKASKKIRAVWLNRPYLVDIMRVHCLNGRMRGSRAVEALGLQCIHRLLWPLQLRKFAVDKPLPAFPMDTEERRSRAERLKRNQTGGWGSLVVAQHARQFGHGGSV